MPTDPIPGRVVPPEEGPDRWTHATLAERIAHMHGRIDALMVAAARIEADLQEARITLGLLLNVQTTNVPR